jgi:HSP20 family protein
MANTPSTEKGKPKEQSGTRNDAATSRNAPVRYRDRPSAVHGGWEPVRRLRDEFDRLFDQFLRGWSAPWEGALRSRQWGIDIQETDDSVVVRAEAPGFESSDFDIQVKGDRLVMHATRKAESEEKDRGYREWRKSEFYESVALPTGVDADKVQATYRNGILTVTAPKAEDGKARRITVQG